MALVPLAGSSRALAQADSAPAGQPGRPAKLRLGLASYTLRKFDLDATLAMSKRVGLENICLKSFHLPLEAKPQEIADAAAKVKKADMSLYAAGVITMAKEEQVAQAFNYAKAAGMGMIIAAPTAEMLPLIDSKIRESGIKVAIHNHGPGDKNFPTPRSVYEKVKGFDPRFGLCIDIGHTVRVGEDLLQSTRDCSDRLLDVHIKDVTAATPAGKGTEIGRGIIDIPAFLKLLIELHYEGIVAFEYEENADDPMPGLAESVGYVNGVLACI